MAATALMATAALSGAYAQAEATKAQAKFNEQQARSAEAMAKLQAEDAIERGESEATAVRKKGKMIQGSQRAMMAAAGLDLSSGTAQDLQTETYLSSAEDALRVKNNAYREAWGYKAEGANKVASARMESRAAKYSARSTLLTGGMQAAAYGYEGYTKKKDK
jgi:hypothetical protein